MDRWKRPQNQKIKDIEKVSRNQLFRNKKRTKIQTREILTGLMGAVNSFQTFQLSQRPVI